MPRKAQEISWMPTATALDVGQLARPAPSLTHTLTASALTAVSAAVQEKTALLTQHLAALSALAASPPSARASKNT